MPEAVITVRDVDFSYGAAPVLQSATLEVAEGEFTSIVGPNGGGKTTLLRLMLGLETPQAGCISVLGLPPVRARENVGYMPQLLRSDSRFPITAREVVLMGLMRRGQLFYNRADRARADAALARVGLADQARHQFATLSGGQRQRTLIARAIVGEPKLLLLDEPTAMVDAAAQEAFVTTLDQMRRSCTVVVVSHDMGFVSRMVQKVVFVNRRVRVEATSEVSGRSFEDIYGDALRHVGHSHAHQHGGEGDAAQ
jgi:zinc transport system ATP-binding protein